MDTIIKLITPQIAQEYLRQNTLNRNLNQRHVDFLSEQMVNDQWKENGEPIIIAKGGRLLDGQHRLNAIVKSKKSYRFVVVFNVDKETFSTIDTGKGRSAGDVLSIEGIPNSYVLAAIVKRILSFETIDKLSYMASPKDVKGAEKSFISNDSILNYTLENKTFLLSLAKKADYYFRRQLMKIYTTADFGFAIYLFCKDKDLEDIRLNEFLSQMSGLNLRPKTGIHLLNQRLVNAKQAKERISTKYKWALLIKAWNFYVNDQSCQILRWDEKRESYPLPIAV